MGDASRVLSATPSSSVRGIYQRSSQAASSSKGWDVSSNNSAPELPERSELRHMRSMNLKSSSSSAQPPLPSPSTVSQRLKEANSSRILDDRSDLPSQRSAPTRFGSLPTLPKSSPRLDIRQLFKPNSPPQARSSSGDSRTQVGTQPNSPIEQASPVGTHPSIDSTLWPGPRQDQAQRLAGDTPETENAQARDSNPPQGKQSPPPPPDAQDQAQGQQESGPSDVNAKCGIPCCCFYHGRLGRLRRLRRACRSIWGTLWGCCSRKPQGPQAVELQNVANPGGQNPAQSGSNSPEVTAQETGVTAQETGVTAQETGVTEQETGVAAQAGPVQWREVLSQPSRPRDDDISHDRNSIPEISPKSGSPQQRGGTTPPQAGDTESEAPTKPNWRKGYDVRHNPH